MREIAIVSGKGGTGKTSVTAALANLWPNKILVDCDVDAANLHLILHPNVLKSTDFYSGKKAKIDPEKCLQCGDCRGVCRSESISSAYVVDSITCNGCSACTLVCPNQAIELKDNLAGQWFISETSTGPMIHAALGIGEDNSGKLVSQIRKIAKETAEGQQLETILIDGPPGIGCPVISAITGVDLVLIITEPTLSGFHDLQRIANLARSFNIKTLVCINKYDLNSVLSSEIAAFCSEQEYPVVGKIPFHQGVVEGMIGAAGRKESYNCLLPKEIKETIDEMFEHIQNNLQNLS